MQGLTQRPRPQRDGHDSGRGARPGAATWSATWVIACAVIIALAAWTLMRLLGVAPVVDTGGGVTAVTTGGVVAASVVAGLAAWVTHALLRRAGRAAWWPFVGSTALAVSITGPSWFADGVAAVALICLHVVVGVTLIAGFARTGHR